LECLGIIKKFIEGDLHGNGLEMTSSRTLFLSSFLFIYSFAFPFLSKNSFGDDEMCEAALLAGKSDLFPVNDFIFSRGTNRRLVDLTTSNIQRLRNSLARGCGPNGGPNKMGNNASVNSAVNKILFKRILTSEWLAANCDHLGLDFEVLRQLNPSNHQKTALDVVKDRSGQMRGEFVKKSFVHARHFMSEFLFFQYNRLDYLVKPVCWEENLKSGALSLIMEKLEPARINSESSGLSSGISFLIFHRKFYQCFCKQFRKF
jgi:hypothetical protein